MTELFEDHPFGTLPPLALARRRFAQAVADFDLCVDENRIVPQAIKDELEAARQQVAELEKREVEK